MHIAEFKLSRDLVLADITVPSFYEHLKNWLKDATMYDIDLKRDYVYILFPLGFDDTLFYKDFVKSIGFNVDIYPLNPDVHTESMLYFGNRSRFSIKQFDRMFMKFIKNFIGHVCDGICSLNRFPDIIRNGMHHPEFSVFDNASIVFVQDVPRPILGGAVIEDRVPPVLSSIDLDNEIIRNHVKRFDQTLKNLSKYDLKADIKLIKHPLDINPISIIKSRKTRKRRGN